MFPKTNKHESDSDCPSHVRGDRHAGKSRAKAGFQLEETKKKRERENRDEENKKLIPFRVAVRLETNSDYFERVERQPKTVLAIRSRNSFFPDVHVAVTRIAR